MLQQSDVQGRLRLLRYGLIVIVVVTFLVSLLAPFAALRNVAGTPITDFLGTAILFTLIVAIVAVIVYFGYHYLLTKTWPFGLGGKGGASS
ncbi:MAG TPA: hypothetical protein VHO69_10420 [Phototrophicaceae bacterium]|nr:hypothetical protein [Phototrophicaceae bacterium]